MKATNFLLALLFISATISLNANATNMQIQACDSEKCQFYFKEYKRKVREGYADAMETFATFYHVGYGTDIDLDKALKWYKRASKHRNTVGSYKAGLMYLTEEKMYDVEQGLSYLRKAARAKHSESSYLLGMIHSQSDYGQLDYAEADKWLSQAFNAEHQQTIKYAAYLQYKQQLSPANFPELTLMVESYQIALALERNKQQMAKVNLAANEAVENIATTEPTNDPTLLANEHIVPPADAEMEVIEVTSLTLAVLFEADFAYFKTFIADKRAMTPGTNIYRRSCSETFLCSEMPKDELERQSGR